MAFYRKNHFSFFIFKFKKYFFAIAFLAFAFCLLIFSNLNIQIVKQSLLLWVNSVVPSLFPFFVATELLLNTNIIYVFNFAFKNIMRPVFNLPGRASFPFVMGLIGGSPIGAKITCEFRKNNICSKVECERLLSFTNNSGPLFIIGSIGNSMFGNSTIGLLLFISQILSAITVGFLFRFWKSSNKYRLAESANNNYVTFSSLGSILSQSIKNSILTIFMVGGFIVVFAIVISILKSVGFFHLCTFTLTPIFNFFNIDVSFIEPFLTGLIENTTGIALIANIHIKTLSINFLFISFLLGFSGISIFLQVYGIISKTDLSIKPYLYGKFMQGVISVIYTFLLICIFPCFNFNL